MPKLTLSRAVETPSGPRSSFDLPEVATLALFRGMKLPIAVEAETLRTEIVIEAAAVTAFLSNLLQIPPSFAERIPLDLAAEALAGARPLLPPAWGSFAARIGNATPAG